MPGSAKDNFQQELIGDVHHVLSNFEKPEFTAQYLKEDKVEGSPVDVLLIRYTPSNFIMRYFIDSKTGLVLKKTAKGAGASGPTVVEETFSDYRAINGVQFPFKTLGTSEGKKVSEMTVESVKVNVGVKEETFKK
jgi:hypothetical protein